MSLKNVWLKKRHHQLLQYQSHSICIFSVPTEPTQCCCEDRWRVSSSWTAREEEFREQRDSRKATRAGRLPYRVPRGKPFLSYHLFSMNQQNQNLWPCPAFHSYFNSMNKQHKYDYLTQWELGLSENRSKRTTCSLWFTLPYSDIPTKGPSVWREKLQMFGCSHWLIVKMLSLPPLKWKANGKSLEDESSPEISQMYSVLAGPLSLPEHPFTTKTIAHILKWNSESFFCFVLFYSLKQLHIF